MQVMMEPDIALMDSRVDQPNNVTAAVSMN